MGCCSSTPISASLADEIREIEHASYPNSTTTTTTTTAMDRSRHPNPQNTQTNL